MNNFLDRLAWVLRFLAVLALAGGALAVYGGHLLSKLPPATLPH